MRARLAALKGAGFSNVPACQADLTRRESWAAAASPGVNGHFLGGVMEGAETEPWRWTFERPAYLVDVNERANLSFRLDFRLPRVTYEKTGPVRLTVWINGRRPGDELYASPEEHTFEHGVPPAWIRADKYFAAPEDGQKLGYLFVRGGFPAEFLRRPPPNSDIIAR